MAFGRNDVPKPSAKPGRHLSMSECGSLIGTETAFIISSNHTFSAIYSTDNIYTSPRAGARSTYNPTLLVLLLALLLALQAAMTRIHCGGIVVDSYLGWARLCLLELRRIPRNHVSVNRRLSS